MRTAVTVLTTAAFFTGLTLAQTPGAPSQDQTFFLNQASTPQELTAAATMLRTVVAMNNVTVDQERKALISHGTPDQMMLTKWLVQQLNQPAAGQTATPEYRMAGANADVVRLFRMDSSATNADMTALVTAIRTLADAQRLFPLEAQKTIVARSSVDRLDTAEWIFHQMSPAGQTPGVDSPAFPTPPLGATEGNDIVVQVFRLDQSTTNANLTAIVTAIRTVVDVQRLFPYEASRAIVMRGPSDRVAAAAWLVHQLAKPAGAGLTAAAHEFQIQGLPDGAVHVYFLTHPGTAADLASLTAQIRATSGISRIFPLSNYGAVTLRGRPDQIVTAGAMVATFDAAVR